ncbi:YciI family protein [Pseudonocardia sp. CA-107938]|uniref:YciI family protein n=1 Tax=Pseudonocardia sp. CA-107938 TaxID=3240021 RepID=UPI003D934F41
MSSSTTAKLLGCDYWLVVSTPHASTTAEDIGAHVDEHIGWLLSLEETGSLLMSGPLVDGPEVRAGCGMTVLRAVDAAEARALAEQDPFVRAGLRSFDLFLWRINEGSVGITASLGTGTFRWH